MPIRLLLPVTLLLAAAPASTTTFVFSQSGYSGGATVSGTFTAEDRDGDGVIRSAAGEVSDFAFVFSGNAIVPAVRFGFAALDTLTYRLDGAIGEDFAMPLEGLQARNAAYGFYTGPALLAPLDTGLIFAFAGPADLGRGRFVVAAVPEPATWALLIGGFGAVGASARRLKPARPLSA